MRCSIGSSLPVKIGISGILNFSGRAVLATSSVNIESAFWNILAIGSFPPYFSATVFNSISYFAPKSCTIRCNFFSASVDGGGGGFPCNSPRGLPCSADPSGCSLGTTQSSSFRLLSSPSLCCEGAGVLAARSTSF
jgi:hypothetical protein